MMSIHLFIKQFIVLKFKNQPHVIPGSFWGACPHAPDPLGGNVKQGAFDHHPCSPKMQHCMHGHVQQKYTCTIYMYIPSCHVQCLERGNTVEYSSYSFSELVCVMMTLQLADNLTVAGVLPTLVSIC